MFAEKRARQKLSSSFADSQLDAIGCLPMIIPFILLSTTANEEQAVGDSPLNPSLTLVVVYHFVTKHPV